MADTRELKAALRTGVGVRTGVDEKVLQSKVEKLNSDISKDRKAAKKVARNKDTITTLLQGLNNSPKFTKMIEYSINCIKNLAVDVTSAIELVDEGVIEALLNVSNLNPFNERITELINGAITSLCQNEAVAALVGEKFGAKSIIRSMKTHKNPETLISDCKAMASLMKSQKNHDMFVREGGIAALADMVKMAKGNPDVIAAVSQVASKLADKTEFATQLHQAGISEEIIIALKANPQNTQLAEFGVAVIGKVARAAPAAMEGLKKLGAVDLVVSVLEYFPENKAIIANGASALQYIGDKTDVTSSLTTISTEARTGVVQDKAKTAAALTKISGLMLVTENVDTMLKNEGIAWLVTSMASAATEQKQTAALNAGNTASMATAGGVAGTVGTASTATMHAGSAATGTAVAGVAPGGSGVATTNSGAATSGVATAGVVNGATVGVATGHAGAPAAAGTVTAASDGPSSLDMLTANQKILFSGCQALFRVATDETKIYTIMQKGGVKLLVTVATGCATDEKVAVGALATLTKMATRKENCVFLAKSGAIAAAIAVIQAQPGSSKAALQALELYEKLSMHQTADGSCGYLLSGGALDNTVQLMTSHIKNAEVCLAAVKVLSKMGAAHPDFITRMTALGGLQAMCSALTTHKDNVELIQSIFALIEMVAATPGQLEQLQKLNVIPVMLAALGAHPLNAELQIYGKRMIAQLQGAEATNQLKEAVDNVGIIIRGSTGSQTATWGHALANAVAHLGNLALMDDNLEYLTKHGAGTALLTALTSAIAMPQSAERETLMVTCSAGLSRLAHRDAGATATTLLQAGLMQQLMHSVVRTNEQVAEHSLIMLESLTAVTANIAKLVVDGSIEDIIEAAKAHPLNERILAAAARSLGNIATNPANIARILASGGAEVIVESMFANMESASVLLNNLETLAKLTLTEEGIQAFLAAGALDALLEILRVHLDNPALITACLQALARMLISEEIAQTIGEAGVMPIMVKHMRTFYANEPLVEITMILLDSLASIPENTKRLLEPMLGTLDLVKWVASAYPSNGALVEAAAKLLATLTTPAPGEAKSNLMVVNAAEALDGARCEVIVGKLKGSSPQELQVMMTDLNSQLGSADNAKLVAGKGGLQALASVIKSANRNETLFYSAASAFLTLTESMVDADFMRTFAENPDCLDAMCDLVMANEIFATPMDLAEMTRAVGAIAKLKLTPAVVKELLKGKPIQALVKIIIQSDDAKLLAQAARLLGKLSSNDEAAALIRSLLSVRDIIQAMKRNIKHEDFLKYVIFLLGNLAQENEEIMNQVGSEGGIPVILQVADMYNKNAALVANCCYCLSNITFNHEVNCTFVVACKGIPAIINIINQHTRAEELLDHAVCILCNISLVSDANKNAVVAGGGAMAVVNTVLNNFNGLDLLLSCFRTIGNLAYNRETINAIIKAGGVQGIVAGMTVHTDNEEVIDVAIKVLTNLSTDLEKESMAILAQEGAVQAVVEVANQYISSPPLEIAAFACLGNLARTTENARIMINQGVIDAAIKASKALGYSPDLTEPALRLIAQLTFVPSELEKIMDSRVVPAIILAMKINKNHKRIISAGLVAIGNLSSNPDNANKVAADGALNQIKDVIALHGADIETMGDVYSCLSNVSRSNENAVAMAPTVIKALTANLRQANVTTKFLNVALTFMSNLCVHPDATEHIRGTELIAAVLVLMKKSALSEPTVFIRSARALENCAYGSDLIKSHMKAEGTEHVVTGVADQNANKDDVKRACRAVLIALNSRKDATGGRLLDLKMGEVERKRFGDRDEKKNPMELSDEVRNFLTSGALLIKHSKTAAPRNRHVYCDTELKYLIWKDTKEQVTDKTKMKVFKIRSIERGRCSPNLKRKNLLGKFLASKEECCFAIMGRERSVDLEAKTEAEREKWISCLQQLVDWHKAVKSANQQFDQS